MDLIETLKKVKKASRELITVENSQIRDVLMKLADLLESKSDKILEANQKDLAEIDKDDPIYDRILLNEQRIKDISQSVRSIADYDSPIGEVLEERTLENGLELKKVRTPIGVIGAIFEGRPNVVIDIFVLCFKSQNSCVLKGGSDASNSNEILIDIIKKALGELAPVVELLPNDREVVAEFLKMDEYIDVIIPRGGHGLIDFVRKTALMPAIETGAGVVHTFFDESGETAMGANIVYNAKTTRPSVCNSLDTLLVHESRVADVGSLCEKMASDDVEIYADEACYEVLRGVYPNELLYKATEDSFGTEYLSLKISVKVVDGIDEAISHINEHGSMHSEAIVTEDDANAARFLNEVDAAAVYVNTSTRFTDGGVFGLGAEVGISTQKLHARGPMGIKELTSYKWIVRGDGQIRN